jgi:hypothetical protein
MASAQLIQSILAESNKSLFALKAAPTAISRGSANPLTLSSLYLTMPSEPKLNLAVPPVFVQFILSA